MGTAAVDEIVGHGGRLAQRVRVMVPMRDGVLLATDIHWPAGRSLADVDPMPILLERSPYDVRAMRRSDGLHRDGQAVTPESGAVHFVDEGWIVVRQDCRGRGGSGGRFTKYVNEAEDGYDTHEWLAAQPWCDGRVATHGVSYGAHTQAAAASVGAGHLIAMVMDSGGFSSAFEAGGRFGGAFELKQAVWSFRRATQAAPAERAGDLEAWFDMMPWRRGASPLSFAPDYEDFLFEQWQHEDFDDFWTQPGLYARGYYPVFPRVPVLSMSSWYDPYIFTAVENYRALVARHPGTSLVLGPWTHGARSVTFAGDIDLGRAATLDGNLADDYLEFKQRWMTEAMAGAPGRVDYFLMGGGTGRRDSAGRLSHGGTWRRSTTWPPPESSERTWFLHGDQTLDVDPPVEAAQLAYDFDPREPVPSRGGGITSGEPLMHGGGFDQTFTHETSSGSAVLPLNARPDVLSFQTPPLDAALAVAGPVAVTLEFSSDAPDTDLAITLVDVYPPSADYPHGYALNITDGMMRVRYRDDPAHPSLMEPGTVYDVEIALPDTANLFAAGHRLRLDITSSNFPRCDVNPNTGEAVMGARTWQVARNVIHTERSTLRLNALPAPADQ